MVDGGECEVKVTCDEDYLVAMAYVADCHTYKRDVTLELADWNHERNKMVDLFLRLLNFQWKSSESLQIKEIMNFQV
mgnify:CR=1 FL=1